MALPDEKDTAAIIDWLKKHPIEGDKDVPPLAVAEKFMSHFLFLKRGKDKIKCMRFQKDLPASILVPGASIAKINSAISAVLSSEGLSLFLKSVLGFGNTLNGGSFRANSHGIKISEIRDVLRLSSNKGKVPSDDSSGPIPFRPETAFHFLAQHIAMKYPSASADSLNESLNCCHVITSMKFDSIMNVHKVIFFYKFRDFATKILTPFFQKKILYRKR